MTTRPPAKDGPTAAVAERRAPASPMCTPGPWFVESHGIMDATRSRTICIFGDSDQDDADQALVALAPTLRDALVELVALKDGLRDVAYKQRKPIAWDRAREVLDALNIDDAGASDATSGEVAP